MEKTITITVPEEIVSDLEGLAREKGCSEEEIVVNALKRRIAGRRFRTLANKMSARAEELGIQSDQDVFDRVS